MRSPQSPLLSLALSALLALAAAGCDDEGSADESPYTFTFRGAGYGPHAGEVLSVVVVDDDTGEVVARDEATLIEGTFSFTFPSLLAEGRSYHVDFFADHDDDGFCDEPPTDHVWRVPLGRVSGPLTLEEDHSTDFNGAACEHFDVVTEDFDLTFTGTGFDVHEGQTFSVAVIDDATDAVVVRASTQISGGAFSFTFPDVLEAHGSYHVDYYADVNGNDGCDPPPDDHVWREPLGEVLNDVVHAVVHHPGFTPGACEHFPEGLERYDLAFSGSGYTPHEGQTISVAVVEEEMGLVAVERATTVAGGAFAFVIESVLVEGRSYHLDYYVDFNENAGCDPPPSDHVWRDELGEVTGDVVHVVEHNLSFTAEACEHFPEGVLPRYDLTLSGSGYAPHEGQRLTAAVVDAGGEVVAQRSADIAAGAFSLTFAQVLAEGETYHVDYYADFNENGACDPPPDDHVWRDLIEAVTGAVDLEVAHDLDFAPEACDSFDRQRFDLDFTGTGFDPHEGQAFLIAVVDRDSGDVVARDSAVVEGGGVWFGFYGVLEAGASYFVDYYTDFNENGACDPPPDDHLWQETVEDVTDHQVMGVTHTLAFAAEACDSF